MVFIGTLTVPGMPPISGSFNVAGGLFTIINGKIGGGELTFMPYGMGPLVVVLPDGEYCSTMAQESFRAIEPKFIEPGSVTVQQVIPSTDADIAITKIANGTTFNLGDGCVVNAPNVTSLIKCSLHLTPGQIIMIV